MDLILLSKALLAAAAAVSVWFIGTGLRDMQRVNAANASVVETAGVIRRVKRRGLFGTEALLSLSVGEDAAHVDCMLPAPWFRRARWQPTDLVRVYWRRGDKTAVAAATVAQGQQRFILGFAALTLAALMYVMLY